MKAAIEFDILTYIVVFPTYASNNVLIIYELQCFS